MERRRRAGFIPISAHYNYEGFHFRNFTILPHFRGTNSPNRHFRLFAFRPNTANLTGRQRWADFGPIFARANYAGPQFPILRFYRASRKLISRSATSGAPHSGRKRRFRGSADGGRIPDLCPPTEITRGRHCPFLRFYRTFAKLIHRIATSDDPHFGQRGHSGGKRWADSGPIFAQSQLRGFHFPILRPYRTFGEPNLRIAHPDESQFGEKRRF